MAHDNAALVPSISVENLVQQRNAMVERIEKAHALLLEAQDLSAAIAGGEPVYGLDLTFSSRHHGYFTHRDGSGVRLMTKMIDAAAWSHLLNESGLRSFLDNTAREQWRTAIDKLDIPVLTQANIEATFSGLFQARGEMFERGVVELFRSLSWHYKTNTPVKLGKRIVLTHMVEGHTRGRSNDLYGISHNGSNKLDDLVRVMSILDGKPEPDHRNGAYHELNRVQWMRNGSGVNVATLHDYITVKGFKNRNAHVAFLRADLVDKMNAIITKHHPNALPPADETSDEG